MENHSAALEFEGETAIESCPIRAVCFWFAPSQRKPKNSLNSQRPRRLCGELLSCKRPFEGYRSSHPFLGVVVDFSSFWALQSRLGRD